MTKMINKQLTNSIIDLLISLILVVYLSSLPIDLSQDLGSYVMNLENNALIFDVTKSFWYTVILFPIHLITTNAENTILVMKMGILLSFYYAYSRKQNIGEKILIGGLLILLPTISENYEEFLRQGTALVFAIIGFYSRNKYMRIGFFILALAFHPIVILPILFYHLPIFLLKKDKVDEGIFIRLRLSFWIQLMFLYASIIICLLIIVFREELIIEIEYFEGKRENIFAATYLITYSIYLNVVSNKQRKILHISSNLMILAILACYPLITDFGRMISIVTPIHLMAAVSLSNRKFKILDLGVLSLLSLVLFIL
ncbi:MAG: hypothetical protein VW236_01245 [Flavobacteriaceae bacterium]